MLFDLSEDQEFFRETTARYLDDRAPVAEVRRLRDDDRGFTADYWRGGAELGWTSLLVSEEHGGGSISGSPVVDLTVIAHELGAHAAPGPFLPTNLVLAALSDAGAHTDVLASLLAGEAVASWVDGRGSITARRDGDSIVIDGLAPVVEAAQQASHLLVAADGVQVLVPADTAGITAEALQSVDLTRRFAEVRFDGVRVPVGAVVSEGDAPVERQRLLALVALSAESVGAMQRGFDMTVEWAFDRYSFGRPLASYQALKHRFADMKMWLEASHAVTDAAAAALDAGVPAAEELAHVAKAYVGELGSELLQDCVQLHGGIGITFEHDLHLFLRRHTLDRALFGTPEEHRQWIGRNQIDTEGAA